MSEYLTTTTSMCRVCRRLIQAQVRIERGGVWFYKICPEHGSQNVLVYNDASLYRQLGQYHRQAAMPLTFAKTASGCPSSCGLCPEHEQHVCLPIIEITDHCNLDCPVCLVAHPGRRHLSRMEVAGMLDGLIRSERTFDVINLSGGEPTLHPDFRGIVDECVKRPEIARVSVSTNGTILARDEELIRFLAERQVIISLQYDGGGEGAAQTLRGCESAVEKHQLIEQCARLGATMSLTATVARGVNDSVLPEVADLLFRQDHIISAMFQPAAYMGHGNSWQRPEQATTTPDVIRVLEGSGNGTVTAADFSPLPCSHPACFSLAFYLKIDTGRFIPIKQLVNAERYLNLIQNRAIFGADSQSFGQVNDAIYELWSGPAALSPDSQKALRAVKNLITWSTGKSAGKFGKSPIGPEMMVKSIFIHQFMDPDTFDLSRVRKCCQVYPQPDGSLLPVCVRNCLKSPAN